MKKALITGANKGIGFAIAKALGNQGWQVLVGARNEGRGIEAVKALKESGVAADFVKVDLSAPETLKEAADVIGQKYDSLSLLVNNAGVPGKNELSYDTSVDDLRSTMQVNFFGTFELTQLLLPVLEKNNGRIVNITIPTVANPNWNPFAYKATKAAQNVMKDALAIDFEAQNRSLEIFSIHPGPTTTDLNGNLAVDGFKTADTVGQEIVDVILDGQKHQGDFIELHEELK
ncbi:SDR family NAD(P)-dependent oxidoreductase [Fructobacillus durionis]|uniref:NAD(P)-dependent dehydrogenase, short-chain alcohol dehydrogenase family n=1 Tax=Fructobacillus durionis TaxID=283737 RepID=A0A1I1EI57_9LACO|nr:SDR family NAD(P)-dependent oxidoreductase [Fructobacillus durionis]SFB86741.1 NAD(P)-dependent dehydrogenase, short-chain alcohol dehydrogenase family [Fructobacillus durionis]